MIAIVDFGSGNLRSVEKAFRHLGVPVEVTDDPARVATARGVVLPGVGSFGPAARALKERGLDLAVRRTVAEGRPFLGICLGLQLLLDSSEEAPLESGLGLVRGRVVAFDRSRLRGLGLKVPHMGWSQVAASAPEGGGGLPGLEDGAHYYFVHSYHAVPDDASWVAARADHGGAFCAAIGRGHVWATQFHPEKSHRSGLRILEAFAGLRGP
ncbi:MAG: imidazole glycerol phosphate synthase subunit HisH [Planctomycetes bacterium]|nr:imidazole glycerol phosphate synthase subunit HisH [Planctomycetota bacterium]